MDLRSQKVFGTALVSPLCHYHLGPTHHFNIHFFSTEHRMGLASQTPEHALQGARGQGIAGACGRGLIEDRCRRACGLVSRVGASSQDTGRRARGLAGHRRVLIGDRHRRAYGQRRRVLTGRGRAGGHVTSRDTGASSPDAGERALQPHRT